MNTDLYKVEQVEVEMAGNQQEIVERANVDIQVTTAKRFPRDLIRVKNNSIALVTSDKETAQSCSYALPRGGKQITGASVHLARILAQQFGNIRAEARVIEITDKEIVSRGTAWDLENNYAVAFEVRRSIMSKNGRFNDDMITVTGNAANAIAYRNAVLSVIPKNIADAAYNAAQNLITGDLSSKDKLSTRREKAISFFLSEYGITEEEILKLLGKQKANQINANDIATLLGMQQSLKDGDTTVDDLMNPIRGAKSDIENKKKNMKNRKSPDLP